MAISVSSRRWSIVFLLLFGVGFFYFPNSSTCDVSKVSSGDSLILGYGHEVVYFLEIDGRSDTSRLWLHSANRDFDLFSGKFHRTDTHERGVIFLKKNELAENSIDVDRVRLYFTSDLSVKLVRCETIAPLSRIYNAIFYLDLKE